MLFFNPIGCAPIRRASDPELVKRMKSELRVLVAEEDYQQGKAAC